MQCTQRHFQYQGVPAKNFAGLMELYECIYIRLRTLVPDADTLPDYTVSRIPGVLDLHLRVTERARFTTTYRLTYMFHDRTGEFPAPDMLVRLYHDAQVGEVISCGRLRGKRHALYHRMYHHYSLAEKWRMNRFLQKWLGYCLMQGHRFIPGQVVAMRDAPESADRKRATGTEA